MTHRILVIDDDPTIQRVISAILSSHNYQVSTVDSVADGFASIEQTIPDLILCDVMMPITNGLEFIEQCKKRPETNEIPIISVSGSGDLDMLQKAVTLGAFAYLSKPFSSAQLIEMIQLALQEQP